MAVRYSTMPVFADGGQTLTLRTMRVGAAPESKNVLVFLMERPEDWKITVRSTRARRARELVPIRSSPRGLVYVRIPELAAGRYLLQAQLREGAPRTWIRLYVTDGKPPSPYASVGHRIDSLGLPAIALLGRLRDELEERIQHTRGGPPRVGAPAAPPPLPLGGECFAAHNPSCVTGDTPACVSTEGGDGDAPACAGSLGEEGDQPCGGGLVGQDQSEPCEAFDLACGAGGGHSPMPCNGGTDAFDMVTPCLTAMGSDTPPACDPPSSDTTSPCDPASSDTSTPCGLSDTTTPGCNPPDYFDPPCGLLLGQTAHLYVPPVGDCSPSISHVFICNLLDTHFRMGAEKPAPRAAGLTRFELPDYILAIMGSRLEHESVPASRVSAFAKKAGLRPAELRTTIDILNSAADVALALFDETQGRVRGKSHG